VESPTPANVSQLPTGQSEEVKMTQPTLVISGPATAAAEDIELHQQQEMLPMDAAEGIVAEAVTADVAATGGEIDVGEATSSM